LGGTGVLPHFPLFRCIQMNERSKGVRTAGLTNRTTNHGSMGLNWENATGDPVKLHGGGGSLGAPKRPLDETDALIPITHAPTPPNTANYDFISPAAHRL
jgi:hypothetical protein